ncbi:hypothetical protein AB0N23_02935 [Streptomyces sp. NPDC052644]
MTTGCLTILIALVIVLAIVVSWVWSRNWHDENVNSERHNKTAASLLQQARATADETARALEASGATDADILTGVIWRRSEAPLITYDTSSRKFTATVARSARYDAKVMLPGGGPVTVTRCFVFTYTPRDRAWTGRVSERDDDACRPSTRIGSRARLALTRISNMHDRDLTRAGLQHALDPTGRRSLHVKKVAREKDGVVISVLVSSSAEKVDQCYRFTRPTGGNGGQGPTSAVPTASC